MPAVPDIGFLCGAIFYSWSMGHFYTPSLLPKDKVLRRSVEPTANYRHLDMEAVTIVRPGFIPHGQNN
jgi:hypothetical protein